MPKELILIALFGGRFFVFAFQLKFSVSNFLQEPFHLKV